MRRLLIFGIVVAGIVILGGFLGERKAEAMIAGASAMGEERRYLEALSELDAIETWLSWTDASQRVEEVRTAIREIARRRGEEDALVRRSADQQEFEDVMRNLPEAQRPASEAGPDWMREQQERLDRMQQAPNAMERHQAEVRRMEALREDTRSQVPAIEIPRRP